MPTSVPSKSLAELNKFGHIKGNRNPNVHAWLVALTPTYTEYGSIVIEQKYRVIYHMMAPRKSVRTAVFACLCIFAVMSCVRARVVGGDRESTRRKG